MLSIILLTVAIISIVLVVVFAFDDPELKEKEKSRAVIFAQKCLGNLRRGPIGDHDYDYRFSLESLKKMIQDEDFPLERIGTNKDEMERFELAKKAPDG
ncbi:MAG: hypothetical protein WC933_01275 [Candidatus Paceibacterota bacterium]|jgi:hypothetical protein